MLYLRKVKVGIPESLKVGWYPLKKTRSSHLKYERKKRDIPKENQSNDKKKGLGGWGA